ncbi:MAG: AAA family ATPase [Bdellovibrionota bacterium]
MPEKNPPSPEEIQKEFEEFVRKKFGGKVQIISQGMDFQDSMPEDHHEKDADIDVPEERKTFDLNFDLTPKEVKAYLDRFIIKQDEAKKALAIAVCDHYNQVAATYDGDEKASIDDYSKQNVLILGPTGVGKTYMIKQIAKLIGVPFVKADATRFSETGYMGANVDDLVRDLVHQAGDDVKMAQFGIVYLDEADKLAVPKQLYGRDVSGRGVQLGMLKLMEETEVDLRSGNDPASQMQAMIEFQKKGKVEKQIINTKHILFIVSGAFTGLDKIINRRLNKKAIGFKSSKNSQSVHDQILHEAITQDFIDFGFEPEFVGRLPVRVACDHLQAEDLYQILKNSEGSVIKQYVAAFHAYGIDAEFTDDALTEIARLAESEKTGARALMTLCEKILRDYKFELPSTGITKLQINKELVEHPAKVLRELLSQPNVNFHKNLYKKISMFEENFARQHGMTIEFSEEARDEICTSSSEAKQPVCDFLSNILNSYEYGLKLVQQNTGQKHFLFDAEVVRNPRQSLERIIRDSYESASKKPEEELPDA